MATATDPDTAYTKPLAGRSVLVTGGSRGIGRAITRRLAIDGAFVVFTYHTQAAAAETLVTEVTEQGGRACAGQLDLAAADQIAEAFDAADRAFAGAGFDGLDSLVANAGVFTSAPIEQAQPRGMGPGYGRQRPGYLPHTSARHTTNARRRPPGQPWWSPSAVIPRQCPIPREQSCSEPVSRSMARGG